MNALALRSDVSFDARQFHSISPAMSYSSFDVPDGGYEVLEGPPQADSKSSMLMIMLKNAEMMAAYALPILVFAPTALSGARYDAVVESMAGGRLPARVFAGGGEIQRKDAVAEAEEKQRAIEEINTQWRANLFDLKAGRGARTLIGTTKPLMSALLRFGPEVVDLTNLDANEVNGMHLAVILRATAIKRDKVPGWNDALKVAETALEKAGVNPTNALLGLK